ncbi:MAG: cytochrome P450 [Promethearchaeota archaeon]|nr:MAG: cytochrome P450 [Candidatus Lokiarchaeota archaeon]
MKTFRKKDGGVIQLINKEKMMDWPVELPLIYIEYIRSERIESYGDAQKEVTKYLNSVLKDVAVPRLIEVLEGKNDEEIINALDRIENIANQNLDMARPIKPYLEDLIGKKNKDIKEKANNILELFRKEERRKELNKRRKKMKEKEDLFMQGKISAEEYADARKKYIEFRDNR